MTSQERFLSLGKTVMPMRIDNIKEIAGVEVDEEFGSYTVWNTPNSKDLFFGRIGRKGYIEIRGNPRWVHQFHPKEWPLIEEKLDNSPFVDEFGTGQWCVISESNWNNYFQQRCEREGYSP